MQRRTGIFQGEEEIIIPDGPRGGRSAEIGREARARREREAPPAPEPTVEEVIGQVQARGVTRAGQLPEDVLAELGGDIAAAETRAREREVQGRREFTPGEVDIVQAGRFSVFPRGEDVFTPGGEPLTPEETLAAVQEVTGRDRRVDPQAVADRLLEERAIIQRDVHQLDQARRRSDERQAMSRIIGDIEGLVRNLDFLPEDVRNADAVRIAREVEEAIGAPPVTAKQLEIIERAQELGDTERPLWQLTNMQIARRLEVFQAWQGKRERAIKSALITRRKQEENRLELADLQSRIDARMNDSSKAEITRVRNEVKAHTTALKRVTTQGETPDMGDVQTLYSRGSGGLSEAAFQNVAARTQWSPETSSYMEAYNEAPISLYTDIMTRQLIGTIQLDSGQEAEMRRRLLVSDGDLSARLTNAVEHLPKQDRAVGERAAMLLARSMAVEFMEEGQGFNDARTAELTNQTANTILNVMKSSLPDLAGLLTEGNPEALADMSNEQAQSLLRGRLEDEAGESPFFDSWWNSQKKTADSGLRQALARVGDAVTQQKITNRTQAHLQTIADQTQARNAEAKEQQRATRQVSLIRNGFATFEQLIDLPKGLRGRTKITKERRTDVFRMESAAHIRLAREHIEKSFFDPATRNIVLGELRNFEAEFLKTHNENATRRSSFWNGEWFGVRQIGEFLGGVVTPLEPAEAGRTPAAPAAIPPAPSKPLTPETQEDFDALAPGARYIDPEDGLTYTK